MGSAKDDNELTRPSITEAMPLVIGVTGHRDLVADEIPGIEAAVRDLLGDLVRRFPGRPLRIMSPLAEGADRLVALVAEDLGIELVVPLPMPENIYAQDFESSKSWVEFSRLLNYATETTLLALAPGSTEESIRDHSDERNRQYAEVGAWIATRCDILVAIWDGKISGDLGGTGQVVQFRRDGEMPGYVPHASGKPARNIVFHIACSRNRDGGEPETSLEPLQTRWLGAGGKKYSKFPAALPELLAMPASPEEEASARAAGQHARRYGYQLPLVIGVTGHRDLRQQELPAIRERVRELFIDLQERFPNRKLRVLSPLAEGADRLVANVAVELGVELSVLMPMPRVVYETEFSSAESIAEFDAFYAKAHDVFELPIARGGTIQSISKPGRARDLQYAQSGVFLSAHCHILLALWDGKLSGQLGGTAQVVRFHHHDIMPGYTTRTVATKQMLIDDESDLIYHIVCSRQGPDGSPAEGFEPLECWWFTNDRLEPRQRDLPDQHKMIFARSSEFSEDSIRFQERIRSESFPLMPAEEAERLPRGLAVINHVFCISDWLAIHYQKLTLRILRITHLLAFLMGFMFILFSDLRTQEIYMIAFLAFFALSAGAQMLARRKGWHRKYLDYRTLAEGLRVQFYLSAAGVTNDNESKFTHDNFLQTQDPELGWIRNVMRVAGTRCDADRQARPECLQFALKEWIGDHDSGQLGYYRRKAAQWIERNRGTEQLSRASLATSIVVVLLILFGGPVFSETYINPLFVLMGSMLLLYGVRQGYAQSTAEKELIKQYEFMLRVFHNSWQRLENADDDLERRQILRSLGGSCLDEHTEWILMHRDRSIDQGDIWRLGG